jgi:hypothetical protein
MVSRAVNNLFVDSDFELMHFWAAAVISLFARTTSRPRSTLFTCFYCTEKEKGKERESEREREREREGDARSCLFKTVSLAEREGYTSEMYGNERESE